MSELERQLGLPIRIRGYGCVACERYHYEGDALFEAHLIQQSKHGIESFPACIVADVRERKLNSEPTPDDRGTR